jgi:hypothetical protein
MAKHAARMKKMNEKWMPLCLKYHLSTTLGQATKDTSSVGIPQMYIVTIYHKQTSLFIKPI